MQKYKNSCWGQNIESAGILPWEREVEADTPNESELLGNTATYCEMIDCSKGNFFPDFYRQLASSLQHEV